MFGGRVVDELGGRLHVGWGELRRRRLDGRAAGLDVDTVGEADDDEVVDRLHLVGVPRRPRHDQLLERRRVLVDRRRPRAVRSSRR